MFFTFFIRNSNIWGIGQNTQHFPQIFHFVISIHPFPIQLLLAIELLTVRETSLLGFLETNIKKIHLSKSLPVFKCAFKSHFAGSALHLPKSCTIINLIL